MCIHSTLCDAVRILHTISEGMVTRLLALCTVLPVYQNYRTEKREIVLEPPASVAFVTHPVIFSLK